MKLITTQLLSKFKLLGSQEKVHDPIVVAKYFYGSWTWYATEYIPEERIFFGYVVGLDSEWGYFSLDELESFQASYGLGVERDLYIGYIPLSKHLAHIGHS